MKRILFSLILGGLLASAGAVSAAPPAPYVNVILNPSFTAGFSNWTVFGGTGWDIDSGVLLSYAASSPADIQQDISFSASSGDKYEIAFSAGNSSADDETLLVQFYNGVDSTGWITCAFTVPAESGLATYRMRGVLGAAMAQLRLRFRYQSLSQEWLMLDNLSAHLSPGAQHTTTICDSPPAPTATPTPTPDTAVVWALPTQTNPEGTPQPAQYARLSYDFTAGDLAISVLLAAVLFTTLCVFTVWLLIGRKK